MSDIGFAATWQTLTRGRSVDGRLAPGSPRTYDADPKVATAPTASTTQNYQLDFLQLRPVDSELTSSERELLGPRDMRKNGAERAYPSRQARMLQRSRRSSELVSSDGSWGTGTPALVQTDGCLPAGRSQRFD